MSGYSGTPLARKLGLKEGHRILLVQEPAHYHQLFSDWPEVTEMAYEDVAIDFIHLFVTDRSMLVAKLEELVPKLDKQGLLWISWPKGKSKIPSNVNREVIRECGLAAGLVDVKVCAVDEDWSGLKFVYRLKDR